MKATRMAPACLLALLISAVPCAQGAPFVVPQDVVNACRADTRMTFQECMARSGLPSEGFIVDTSPTPACIPNACLVIASPQTETMTQTMDGETVSIPHRNRLELVRPSLRGGDWKIEAASNMNLFNLQRLVRARVQANLPPNKCEVENMVTSQSESVSGDVYVYQADIRTDVRTCANVPCVPEVWKTCVAISDVGRTNSQLTVNTRFFIEDSKLKVVVDSNFAPGPMPGALQALFNLERFFNFATGHMFRSGNERQYREAVENAVTAAIAQSGEKISQRLNVPGAQAFKFRVDGVSLSMRSDQLQFGLKASGVVPAALVCDVQQSLLQQYNLTCPRGR
jgi:hypothetical protein